MVYMKNKVENSPYTVIASGSASGAGLTSATINGYINGEPIGSFFFKPIHRNWCQWDKYLFRQRQERFNLY